MRIFITCLLLSAAIRLTGDAQAAASDEHFERNIRPILVEKCFRCHGGERTAGELRVDSRANLFRGGESGPALMIDANAPAAAVSGSLLLKAIRREDDVSAMPPEKPLSPEQVTAFEQWVAAGAVWPDSDVAFESKSHWAFQKVEQPQLPLTHTDNWCVTDIDAFVLQQMQDRQQQPLPEADRYSLVRRITYDLTGLPPTISQISQFVNNPGSTTEAITGLIDGLLASPQYGEHWGRHWLDVVRYADTAGENSDHPLPHAWRYRNWVINAFNIDMPYDQFVREQIAGDLLASKTTSTSDAALTDYAGKVTATGYLAIARRFGHDIDKDIHLTHEDVIDNLGKNFLGLTLGCCRCHDHKYDPLSTEDYYALYGVFASTKFAFPGCEPQQQPRDLVPLLPDLKVAELNAAWEQQKATIESRSQQMRQTHDALQADIHVAFTENSHELASGEIPDAGSSPLSPGPLIVNVRAGHAVQVSVSPQGNHGADSTILKLRIVHEVDGQAAQVWDVADLLDNLLAGNPHPGKVAADGQPVAVSLWCFLDIADGLKFLPTAEAAVDGRSELQAWKNGDTPSVFVNRSTEPVPVWTTLPPRTFFVHPGPGGPVSVTWLSPVEGIIRIEGHIADAHPGVNGVGWKIEHIANAGIADKLRALGHADTQLQQLTKQIQANQPVIPVSYAVTEGTASNVPLQLRGNPEEPGEIVNRRFLSILGGAPLGDESHSGRMQLAEQITRPDNPLMARVIVNRIWQKHFGTGIVATPNDFGVRGATPSNQSLLDFLANDFVTHGYHIKRLHQQIVLSAAYRQQTVASDQSGLSVGHARRRLTAEELRDTLLFASGQLDDSPGESHPFPAESTWSFTQHAPFAAEYETTKRSVYLMQKRNRRNRFFALFDGADPNSSTPVRDVTTAPTQALYLMNDPFVHQSAATMADRLLTQHDNDADRLDTACLQLLGRHATTNDQTSLREFTRSYANSLNETDTSPSNESLTAWLRIMMVSNEALFVP